MSSFLRRWSDRKAEARQPDLPAQTDPSETDLPENLAEAQSIAPELAAEEVERKLAELPSLDEITAETDIRPFLKDFVPAALRKAALRRAWLLDPVISTHLDVARDYAWDFNTAGGQGGFYHGLAREVAKRSLSALDGQPRIAPEESAALQVVAPDEESVTEDLPTPEAEADIAPVDVETDSKPQLKLTSRHGGALPD